MAAPQHVDRQTFLARLRKSGLLGSEELAAVAVRFRDVPRGRVIARALVEQGLLTRFQAEHLLAGKHRFFLGQYCVLEQIGEGGMGRVYKARHRTLNRLVALKVLTPSLLTTDRAQDLFLREVRAIARLIHPNIVTAFDANQEGDRHYLVLEYIDGPNLDQLVRQQGPLPVGRACDFVRQVARGLQYADQLGVVHRDVKPANLLLQARSASEGTTFPVAGAPGLCQGNAGNSGVYRPDGSGLYGVVKISDFGLARLNEAGQDDALGTLAVKENTVMGTPDYLSPEQARNLHKTDIRSDLYSLGCTFYYLLTGQVPFPGGTLLENLIRHGTEEPTPVEQLRPAATAGVAAVVRKLMAKRPEERFQTPAELADALAPFAVRSPAAWKAPAGDAVPYVDQLATPVHPVTAGSDPLLSVARPEDGSAQVATMTPGLSPTSVAGLGPTSSARLSAAVGAQQRRRLKLAVLWASGLVGAGLLAAMLAGMFTR
jgi:serine/threonine-protein kinase